MDVQNNILYRLSLIHHIALSHVQDLEVDLN